MFSGKEVPNWSQRLIWNKTPALFQVLETHRCKKVAFIHLTNIDREPILYQFPGSGDPVVTKAGLACLSGTHGLVGSWKHTLNQTSKGTTPYNSHRTL